MIVHKNNLESLHKKVPKRILPTHLGGDAGNVMDIAGTYGDVVAAFAGVVCCYAHM